MTPDKPIEAEDLTADLKRLDLDKVISENTGAIVKEFGLSNELYEYKITGGLGSNKDNVIDAISHFHENHLQAIADDLSNSFTEYFGLKVQISCHLYLKFNYNDHIFSFIMKIDQILTFLQRLERLPIQNANKRKTNAI